MIPYIIQFSIDNEVAADQIIESILHHKFATCCQKQKIKSKYIWKDEICFGDEYLVTIKTFEEKKDKIERVVKVMHTYETFEFIGKKVDYVNEEYLKYMRSVMKE
ncbi:hypothetical protein BDAP_000011 [Binucleata daphniae]